MSDKIENARKDIYKHPEYNDMISQARQGIAANYTFDVNPYNKLSEMSELAVKLQTAYILMDRQVYADKWCSLPGVCCQWNLKNLVWQMIFCR